MFNKTNWNFFFFFFLGTPWNALTKTIDAAWTTPLIRPNVHVCIYNIKRVQIKWITSTLNYVLLSPPPGRFSHCILIKILLSLDNREPWVRNPMCTSFQLEYMTINFDCCYLKRFLYHGHSSYNTREYQNRV